MGVDPVSTGKKVCSFDCIYCQIGKTVILTDTRKIFIKSEDIIEELDSLPLLTIDYITFSGAGEPTLAANLGEMIKAAKKIRREKIAVISNASLLHREDVREDLLAADLVIAKLDAPTQDILKTVNQPIETITIEHILSGIKMFKQVYKGRLTLQLMFVEQNKEYAQDLAWIARQIQPDEVQINTPLRPGGVKPLSEPELNRIEDYFDGLNTISVYKVKKKRINSISDEDTLRRRGKV